MKGKSGPYKACRHPKATPRRKWVCMDMRDKSIVSVHYFLKNAVAVAALSNSVAAKYGNLYTGERA